MPDLSRWSVSTTCVTLVALNLARIVLSARIALTAVEKPGILCIKTTYASYIPRNGETMAQSTSGAIQTPSAQCGMCPMWAGFRCVTIKGLQRAYRSIITSACNILRTLTQQEGAPQTSMGCFNLEVSISILTSHPSPPLLPLV